jgi:hypothetical protein
MSKHRRDLTQPDDPSNESLVVLVDHFLLDSGPTTTKGLKTICWNTCFDLAQHTGHSAPRCSAPHGTLADTCMAINDFYYPRRVSFGAIKMIDSSDSDALRRISRCYCLMPNGSASRAKHHDRGSEQIANHLRWVPL